jgi:hypothetical protein
VTYRRGVRRWTWWLGLGLGCLLVLGGVAETIRAVRSGDGGLWFWTPTMVGGGTLLIVGTLLLPQSPSVGNRLTTIGAVVALPPTFWTLVVPVLLIVLIVGNAKQASASADKGGSG